MSGTNSASLFDIGVQAQFYADTVFAALIAKLNETSHASRVIVDCDVPTFPIVDDFEGGVIKGAGPEGPQGSLRVSLPIF